MIKERQTGETYESTGQSQRIMCSSGGSCNLNVDMTSQIRGTSYGNALQFAQGESYLNDDDIEIIY